MSAQRYRLAERLIGRYADSADSHQFEIPEGWQIVTVRWDAEAVSVTYLVPVDSGDERL